jgi:hypothetical protein
MAVEPTPSTEDPSRTDGLPVAPPVRVEETTDDATVLEMLLFGTQEIVRGSDTGTLGAFASLAFQQIRGKGLPHQQLGCGLLLFSVLMCALVHVATGNAYFRRAKQILREPSEARRHLMIKRVSFTGALIAALIQLVFLGVGIFLVLIEEPPAVLNQIIAR